VVTATQVLQTRKGLPLSLAVLAGAVARRLGMQLQLLCADDSQLPGTASGERITVADD
jgi:regulator of sirC expression with transglutaminase-like and TPR domain